jgi:hypothetical protein
VREQRTAVQELTRRLELAREALSVSDYFAGADAATVNRATALGTQLKHEIADIESEIRELERPPEPQLDQLELSHDEVASYRPDTRGPLSRHT